MKKYKLSEFAYNGSCGVLFPPFHEGINYSDGIATEEKILNDIQSSEDVSIFSRDLIGKIVNWPTEYHYSPLRHNLLRHYCFKPTDKILELGCGCGAITRQIGESQAIVHAVEGSALRAKCASERCRDLENVDIFCSNFQNIQFDREYDFVTLIGVLEYSNKYFVGEKPFHQCLAIAKSALKESGKLIIAIENRMGLKYMLGYSEDHTGNPYDGLCDFYKKHDVYTFGKKEISELLQQNGFRALKFAYPFPDYKLPKLVVFEGGIKSNKFSVSPIIAGTKSRDYSYPRKELPDESFMWQQLERNELLDELSNSFLIEASFNEINFENNVLAAFYTVNRKREFNTITTFIRKGEAVVVTKEKTEQIESETNHSLVFHMGENQYHKGNTLDYIIKQSLKIGDVESLKSSLMLWINFIFENNVSERNAEDKYLSIIKSTSIDCLPFNLIYMADGSLKAIDGEWEYLKRVTVYSLLLRYLTQIDLQFIHQEIDGQGNSVSILLDYLGISVSEQNYLEYKELDREIGAIVYDDIRPKIEAKYIGHVTESSKNVIFYFFSRVLKALFG